MDSLIVKESLEPPAADDLELMSILGAKCYHDDVQLAQYVVWAAQLGVFRLLNSCPSTTVDQLEQSTRLNARGVDALMGVLVSLGLVESREGEMRLSNLAATYLTPESPYYLVPALSLTCTEQFPVELTSHIDSSLRARLAGVPKFLRLLLKRFRGWEFGGRRILLNQHIRNLPACVTAARSAIFDSSLVLLDVAGGSGSFSIPFAQSHPQARIVLTDLPGAMKGIGRFLKMYGVLDRVELIGMDAFKPPWNVPRCDTVFFGNFIHGFPDHRCTVLLKEARRVLKPGGRAVVHELVWNEERDGPLKTALFNVTMRRFGGQQRSVRELESLLSDAGFGELFAEPTSGGFVMVGGIKPRVSPV